MGLFSGFLSSQTALFLIRNLQEEGGTAGGNQPADNELWSQWRLNVITAPDFIREALPPLQEAERLAAVPIEIMKQTEENPE